MTDLNTILTNLAAALANDTDLATWCSANLGGEHQVFLGVDPEHPPVPRDGAPVIEIATGERVRNLKNRHTEHTVLVGCMVYSNDTSTSGRLTTRTALTDANAFAAEAEHRAVQHLDAQGVLWRPEKIDAPDAFGGHAYRAVWGVTVSVYSPATY